MPTKTKTSSKRNAAARSSLARGSDAWEPAATAPKGPLILADFGWPWPVMAAWSEMSGKWAAVSVQRTETDAWFETETEAPEDLRRWKPWPSLPNGGDVARAGNGAAQKEKNNL